MRSSITLAYLNNGIPIRPNKQYCLINADPDLTDVFGWQDILAFGTAAFLAYEGEWKAAGAAVLPVLRSTYRGKDMVANATDHATLQAAGTFLINGQHVPCDEVRLAYRAWSDDDLTASFAMVSQEDSVGEPQIREMNHSSQTHLHWAKFSIPLATIQAGDYVFNCGSGDDGWFFEVGANTIFTLTIRPAPRRPRQPTGEIPQLEVLGRPLLGVRTQDDE